MHVQDSSQEGWSATSGSRASVGCCEQMGCSKVVKKLTPGDLDPNYQTAHQCASGTFWGGAVTSVLLCGGADLASSAIVGAVCMPLAFVCARFESDEIGRSALLFKEDNAPTSTRIYCAPAACMCVQIEKIFDCMRGCLLNVKKADHPCCPDKDYDSLYKDYDSLSSDSD